MAKLIKFKRGLTANIGTLTLQDGEPAFTTDGKYLYIGIGGGKATFVPLGSDGKLDSSVIPHQAITEVFVVANQAARLALSDAHPGDVAVQTDTNENYILQTAPASTLGNWVKLAAQAAPVTSVGEKTGAITLADLGLDDTSIGNKVRAAVLTGLSTVTNAAIAAADTLIVALGKLQAQINAKANTVSPTFTGTPAAPTAATGTNTTQLATTAFVQQEISTIDGGTF